jgi:hypothetical protein
MPSSAAGVARLVAFDRKAPETVVKTPRDDARAVQRPFSSETFPVLARAMLVIDSLAE